MSKKTIIAVVVPVVLVIAALAYAAFSRGASDTSLPSTKPSQAVEVNQPTAKPSQSVGVYTEYSEAKRAEAQGDILLFFHASWCPQCRAIEASIDKDGIPDGVTVLKVDYDSNQALRQKYGVTLQTTFVKVDAAGNKLASYVAYSEPTFAAVKRELLD